LCDCEGGIVLPTWHVCDTITTTVHSLFRAIIENKETDRDQHLSLPIMFWHVDSLQSWASDLSVLSIYIYFFHVKLFNIQY